MDNIQNIKITIIYDDLNGAEKEYIRSFGFAALIEVEGKKLLFDAGTNEEVLMHNLSMCKVLPSEIDAVILSHNHYDHINGLSVIIRDNREVPIYIHKYWNDQVRFIGNSLPPSNIRVVQEGRKLEELGIKVYVTNCFQSQDYGGIYEQACYIETRDAFVLLCGCSHPGLNVFLNDRKNLGIPEDKPLHIIGGFHGFKFDEEKASQLKRYIRSILIFHCTNNITRFQSQFQEKCAIGIVGMENQF